MTIKELYEWAKSQGLENLGIEIFDGHAWCGKRDLDLSEIEINLKTNIITL